MDCKYGHVILASHLAAARGDGGPFNAIEIANCR